MEDFDFDIVGAEIVYSDIKPKPYNPLRRPKMNYKSFFIAIAVYVVLGLLLVYVCQQFLSIKWYLSFVVWSLVYIALIGRKAAIWMVHLYQNKASDAMRLRCVFEPSCSEYMILCLQRYGLIVGGIKGIKRLMRCHPPNGGKDYPY